MDVRVLEAIAGRDTDGSWTIRIPELVSQGPGGRQIVATGAAAARTGVERAAVELAMVWLGVDESAIAIVVRAADDETGSPE